MSDEYVWLLANMGLVSRLAEEWNPSKHPPLLKHLHQYIQQEMKRESAKWFEKQKELLK